jgi:hypothetical protein
MGGTVKIFIDLFRVLEFSGLGHFFYFMGILHLPWVFDFGGHLKPIEYC